MHYYQPRAPEIREERGVIRDRTAPAGYSGYIAVSAEGIMIGHLVIRRELDTDELRQRCVAGLWRLIEEYDAHASPPTPPSPHSPRLLR